MVAHMYVLLIPSLDLVCVRAPRGMYPATVIGTPLSGVPTLLGIPLKGTCRVCKYACSPQPLCTQLLSNTRGSPAPWPGELVTSTNTILSARIFTPPLSARNSPFMHETTYILY